MADPTQRPHPDLLSPIEQDMVDFSLRRAFPDVHVAVGPEAIDEVLAKDFPNMSHDLSLPDSDRRNLPLNALRDWAHKNSRDHGFHSPSPTVGESVALMHSELSELLEDYRKGRKPNEVFYTMKINIQSPTIDGNIPYEVVCGKDDKKAKLCGIGSELADCMIRCLDFAGQHNIDIEKILIEKMIYNESREYRHGGKKL